jgi:8-oxo-dGTP diphosphatase
VNHAPPADLPLPPATGQQVTLCFIVYEGRVLLMRKLRGIGAGKINGPGGKVEPGESALAAAIRETQEEVGVTPLAPELRGELDFYFEGGPTLHCLVFLARAFTGLPVTTAEAEPLWFPADALPYDQMWSDDRHWLPLLLAGEHFAGWVKVSGETVLSLQIERRLRL